MDGIERITGATKLACLIGSPVAHSASPRMHNASFARMGVDAVYLAFDVAPEELETVAAALVRMKALGYNVTMPHKAAILPLLDEVSDAARLMGAVNTVRIEPDGRTSGHNTDGAGFMRNLAEHGCEVEGKRVVVLGAGSARRSRLRGRFQFPQPSLRACGRTGGKDVGAFRLPGCRA